MPVGANKADEDVRAFSSEVATGSRQENASNQNLEARSDSIGTEKALDQRSSVLEALPRFLTISMMFLI